MLTIALLIINSIITLHPVLLTPKNENKYNIMQGIYYCVTASTNSVATLMIGHQIYSSTRQDKRARRRYRHIIEITIQSSAIYSVTMLASAITSILGGLNLPRQERDGLFIVSNYLEFITLFATVSNKFLG